MKDIVIKIQEWEVKLLITNATKPYTTRAKLGIFPTNEDGKNYAFALDELLDNADYATWDNQVYYFGGQEELYEGSELDKGTFIVGNIDYIDTHYFYAKGYKTQTNREVA